MGKNRSLLMSLLLTVLMTVLFAGCGNSGGDTNSTPPQTRDTTPRPPETGDPTLFPHAKLLASPTDMIPPQTIVLDARRAEEVYNAGHIPGAIFAPPIIFEKNGEEEVLLSADELATILGKMGITRDSKILIYDNTTESLGAGGRLFWILEYLGCTNVTILNGGWNQWKIQEMPVETTVPAPLPPAVFTPKINPAAEFVTKEYVAEHFLPVPDAGFILIDVRTDEEYQGLELNGAPLPGHIPGAVNFPYANCFNADKTILNFVDLKLLLESQGIKLENVKMVAYSTVGHRSGFFYFLCRLMGYSNVANYTGSIVDWGNAALIEPALYPLNLGAEP